LALSFGIFSSGHFGQMLYSNTVGFDPEDVLKMRKFPSRKAIRMAVVSSIIITFALVTFFQPAKAQNISGNIWTGTFYSGYDPYYQSSVKAYNPASTATLTIQVSNGGFSPMYVSAVKVRMDWGQNYTASATFPQIISNSGSATFRISFNVPDTTVASNLYVHSGKSIVEYSTSLGGTTTAVTSDACGYGNGCFIVYTSDQSADINLMRRFGGPSQFPTSFLCGSLAGFTTQQANALCLQASKQLVIGLNTYSQGDFSGAKGPLTDANNLMDQAISAQSSQGPWGDLSTTVGGWGLLLLGISGVIGVVAYALRRRPGQLPSRPISAPTP
jgi:hypothetical protein